MKNKNWKQRLNTVLEEGRQAALAGLGCDPIPYEALELRNAWLIGWRNGGGNIITKQVEQKEQSCNQK